MQAHPRYPRTDWARPARPRWQFALAVAAQTALVLALIFGLLAVGAVAGAVVGFPMDPPR